MSADTMTVAATSRLIALPSRTQPAPALSRAPSPAHPARGVPGDPVEVAVSRLRTGLSPRLLGADRQHAQALAETFSQLPPILVHRPTMTVIDGVHRVLAARLMGRPTIPAVLFEGSESDAYVEAVVRNTSHGKPLTVPERERAAARIIGSHPDWSDRRIAEACGLSAKTVARCRQRATEDTPQSATRVGRDGRRRPIDPAQVREQIAERIRAHPTASVRAIAAMTHSSQATVRDVAQRLRRGEPPGRLPAPQAHPTPPPSPEAELVLWRSDGAVSSMPGADAFIEWFDAGRLTDEQWQRFVDVIPLSRAYLIVGEARRRAESWQAFAQAVEDQARLRAKPTP